MRIAVDATCWNNHRGYGRHLRSLLTAASRRKASYHFQLYVDFPVRQERYPFPPSADVIHVPSGVPTTEAAGAASQRSLGDMYRMGRALSKAPCDLLLFPTVYSFVPVWTRAPKLLMIHDVIAERLPQYVFPTRGGRLRWQLKTALARRQADLVITVSEYSRRTLSQFFRMPADRIAVVGEAPDGAFQQLPGAALPDSLRSAGIPGSGRFIAYVGGFSPHKNLFALLDAFLKLAGRGGYDDAHLILVGDFKGDAFHSCYPELRRRAEASPHAARVHFPGFVPDNELVCLLNRSALLVLPSLMEGYGLPAIEAAACGLPTIVTTESPLPELLGDGAIAVDPHRPSDLEPALARLLDDEVLRRRMGETALAAANALTWSRAADELLEVFDKALR